MNDVIEYYLARISIQQREEINMLKTRWRNMLKTRCAKRVLFCWKEHLEGRERSFGKRSHFGDYSFP